MSIPEQVSKLISAWGVDIVGSWSIMDVVALMATLAVVSMVVNYFYFTAGK